jgi:hypothetical protein
MLSTVRVLWEASLIEYLFWHTIGNQFWLFFSNMFSNLNLTDRETCYKLFNTKIIWSIGFKGKEVWFWARDYRKISRVPNIRIYVVGIFIMWTYEEGKKIGWKDGIRAIYCILKYGLLKIKIRSERNRFRRTHNLKF